MSRRPTLPGSLGLRIATVGAVASSALVPLVRRGLVKANVLDVPNARSSHVAAIPRGGGIAVFAGSAATVALNQVDPGRRALAPAATFALGLADDFSGGLSAAVRLGGQVVIGAASARTVREAVVAAVAVPASVNIFNFMDGINGISATTAVVVLANAALEGSLDGSTRALALAGAGAAAGFLPWNAPTAKIFLGDGGSYYLGGLIATCLTDASHVGPATFARVMAPYSLYVLDVAQAIVLRARRGEDLFEAHRCHVYQRTVDGSAASHIQVAGLHAALATGMALTARTQLGLLPKAVVMTGLATTYLTAARWMPRWRPRRPAAPAAGQTA